MKFLYILFLQIVSLSVMGQEYSKTIPVMFINTVDNAPITSKEEYVDAQYYVETFGSSKYESIGSAESTLPLQIRYRGNWTLTNFEKKPYKIKLGKKTNLLGLKRNKHFALLAHADARRGFLRNTVGFYISRRLGMDYTPDQVPVEVVLNGEYIGLYFLTETIRVDENRLELKEQKDNETDIYHIENGGWLLEIDNYEDPHQYLADVEGTRLSELRVTWHYPEELSNEQLNYVKDQVGQLIELFRNSYKDNESLSALIDLDELAKYYITAEVIDHMEAFIGSCFFHKQEGEAWRFGPVWDCGVAFYEYHDKNQFIYENNIFGNAGIIEEFIKFDRFNKKVKENYAIFKDTIYNDVFPFIDSFIDEIKVAAVANYKRWPQYGNEDVVEKAEYVKECLRTKIEFLDSVWGGQETSIHSNMSNDDNQGLYSLQGQKVGESSKDIFDSRHLKPGVYIVGSKGKSSKKVLVR